MKIIYWLANGFAKDNPHDVDSFSYASLNEAVGRRNAWRSAGEEVSFFFPNSIVRDKSGTVVLRDTMLKVAREVVPEAQLTKTETTGATTDCFALAISASAFRAERLIVCCTTSETARYFRAMYRGVVKYVRPGRKLEADFVAPTASDAPQPDMKSRVLYAVLWFATAVASITKPTFLVWYDLLNEYYRGRLHGFTTTITEKKGGGDGHYS